ncbi:kinase-like domain-containing protein [Chytriomyces sp. MP71]|nr:kinase-like domain-containing protein [Chytriomyces sp. MP71]
MAAEELRDIMSEIDLLKNLYHENIVSYQGFSQTSEHLNIIMEYCENGSLHSILQKFGTFPETLVSLYIAQVLEGLQYLHEQDVIHRDIKAANILTTKAGTVKLADFGISSKLASGLSERESIMGSPYWMPPEIIELRGAVQSSDIWSVGCTVFELLEGNPPYHTYDPMSVLFNIVQDDHPPFPQTAISKDLHEFLKQCWIRDRDERPSAESLLKHTWIRKSKHKAVTRKSNSTVTTPLKNKEANNRFIIPEVQNSNSSDWNNDFLFEDDTHPHTPLQSSIRTQPFNFDTPRTNRGSQRRPSSMSSVSSMDMATINRTAAKSKAIFKEVAESWDEDFDLGCGSSDIMQVPMKITMCLEHKRGELPHEGSRQQNDFAPIECSQTTNTNDYTNDFDFGSDFDDEVTLSTSGPSSLPSQPNLRQLSCKSNLYYEQSVLDLIGNLKANKEVVDTCFELVAMFDIAPQLKAYCLSSHILSSLVHKLEIMKGDLEVLALMTLLNKLLAGDQQTKDRLALLGIVPTFLSTHALKKSMDVRREVLFFVREMCTHTNTVVALLASSRALWGCLCGVYLIHERGTRSQEVAFDSVSCVGAVLGALPVKVLVQDQIQVLKSLILVGGGEEDIRTQIRAVLRTAQLEKHFIAETCSHILQLVQ